jgi:hypothetical protein
MNAEGFSVRGALVANSSPCSSRVLWKNRRINSTTTAVIARNAIPSSAASVHRCCVLFPDWNAANTIFVF